MTNHQRNDKIGRRTRISWAHTLPSLAVLRVAPSVLALIGCLLVPSGATAYPTEDCVAAKQKALSKYCGKVLKAYAKFQKDPLATNAASKLASSLNTVAGKMSGAFGDAEIDSAAAGVDCSESGESSANLVATVEAASLSVAASISTGQNEADKTNLKCRAKLVKISSKLCKKLIKAESKHMAQRVKDALRTKLAAKRTKATQGFDAKAAKSGACVGTAVGQVDPDPLRDSVVAMADAAIFDTEVAPESILPTGVFTEIVPGASVEYLASDLSPLETGCVFGDPWKMWARRGTVNKLLVRYQGGSPCYDNLTCGIPLCGGFSTQVDIADDPSGPFGHEEGFVDLTNPDNPFKDWHIIWVPNCSCDFHLGTMAAPTSYPGAITPTPVYHHKGHINTRFAEKWAREHFVNPEQVFAEGTSGGSVGVVLAGAEMHEAYPSSRFDILSEGFPGLVPSSFFEAWEGAWFDSFPFPKQIPALQGGGPLGLPVYDLMVEGAAYYADRGTHYGLYATAYDNLFSGFVAGFFLQGLVADPFNFRSASCGWNDGLLNLRDTLTSTPAGNFHAYIGSGTDHTVWDHPKVYTDAVSRVGGGTPVALLDWVADMIVHPAGPDWVDAQCMGSECDHTCADWPTINFTCDGNPNKHQDGSTDPVPDCAGAGATPQACCHTDSSCDDLEPAFCWALGSGAQGLGTTCVTTSCP